MNKSKDKNKKIITYLNSPRGYKYKCVIIYEYNPITNAKFNGTFYIGNPKTKVDEACITISVVFPDNMSSVFADPTIASLLFVKYYETCSENKSLPHGEGTADMIYTSMSFVKQICPFVKEFKLNDKCTPITLLISYLLQNEKTWYAAQYNACLKEPYDYRQRLLDWLDAELPQFEIFSRTFIKNTSDVIKNELHSVYNEGDTLRGFFKKLYKKYGKNMSCVFLQPWIKDPITSADLLGYILPDNWYIPVDDIPNYKFNANSTNNINKKRIWKNLKNIY